MMLGLGTNWDDCIIAVPSMQDISFTPEDEKEHKQFYEQMTAYKKKVGKENFIKNNIWYDKIDNQFFSAAQFIYPNKAIWGKDHHFYSDLENSERFVNILYNKIIPQNKNLKSLGVAHCEQDFFYANNKNIDFEKYQGKSVLIVGGGPSVNNVKWENLDYDYVWSCNKFFKNKKVVDKNVDLVSLATDLPAEEYPMLRKLMDDTELKTTFLLEWGDPKVFPTKSMYELANDYIDKMFFFHTRYASFIGVGARMVLMSIFLGAKDIYFVGLDGFPPRKDYSDLNFITHSFEKNKSLPGWLKKYGYNIQRRHMVIFWEYVLSLQKKYKFNIYNLGENSPDNIYGIISKIVCPLDQEVKNKIS